MPVCKNIKGFTRRHERLADFFALLAVVLFFTTLYVGVSYHAPILEWMQQDAILHTILAVGVLVIDLALILFFLTIGAAHYTDEEDEGCFHTFKGRRAGTGSIGLMFNSWLHHMEHVGKKHR